MNDAIYNDTITITEYEAQNTGKMYRLKTDTNEWYTLWRDKTDGTQTKAFQQFTELGKANGLPMTVAVGYKIHVSQKEDKTYENKTIIFMTLASGTPTTSTPSNTGLEQRVAKLETEVAYLKGKLTSREVTTEELATEFGGTITSQAPTFTSQVNNPNVSSPINPDDTGYDVSSIPF